MIAFLFALHGSDLHAQPSATIRVISLNIGKGGRLGLGGSSCAWSNCDQDPADPVANDCIVGLRKFFVETANTSFDDVNAMVYALQEVDRDTARNPGWDEPWYFTDRLNQFTPLSTWNYRFLRTFYLCSSGPDICMVDPALAPDCNCRGEYGMALIGSTDIYKVSELHYQWYTDFPGGNIPNLDYGPEPHVSLGGKIAVNGQQLWIFVTHLSLDTEVSKRQVWQLLGRTGQIDRDTPILIVGDLNIIQNGDHSAGGLTPAEVIAHRKAYWHLTDLMAGAGYERLGAVIDPATGEPVPCWVAGNCTFKPWNDYTVLDYAFLLDPHDTVKGAAMPIIPARVSEPECYLTDHKGLQVDLEFYPGNLPPVARCDSTISLTSCTGSRTLLPATVDDGSYDPDGGSVQLSLSPPGPYGTGDTEIELRVADEEGSVSACTCTLTHTIQTQTGDTNCDGRVNMYDLRAIALNWLDTL